MLLVNLPAGDLNSSRALHSAIGLSVNEHSSDDDTLSVVIADTIVLPLHTHDTFAELVDGEVGDPSRGTMLVSALSTTSQEEVDDLAARVHRRQGMGQGSPTTTACTCAASPTRTGPRGK
jgi:hypothetical protein